MKTSKLTFLIFVVTFFLLMSVQGWADDAAPLYKTKCVACHGADGAGKPAMKMPSLISPEAKKLTDAEITDAIANGGKAQKPTHQFAKKGITPDQIKALVAYVRTLQK